MQSEWATSGGTWFLKVLEAFTRVKGEGGLECELGGQIGMVVCLTKHFDDKAQL